MNSILSDSQTTPKASISTAADHPLKIALFHTTLPEPGRKLGGVEVAVHRLANALAEDKANIVTVYSLTDCPKDAGYQHRQLFENRPWLKSKKLARIFLLPFLLNFVAFEDTDILHFHGDDWFFRRKSLPTVRTMHGSALREARAATSLPRKVLQYAVYPLERLSVRLRDRSMAIGREAAKIYGIPDIVDNGVDVELFLPGDKSDTPRVLFVGTWEGRKRGKFLFDLFLKDVLPQMPTAELLMVSDTCPEHPNVIAEKFPSDTVIAERYRESWVFAYPSTYEGFGIPYLEAMASGTPVLCSPNTGAAYVLADGKFGEVVGDPEFASTLISLLNSPEKRAEMAAAGRKRAEGFAWSAVAERHKKIYEEVVALSRRSRKNA